MIEMSTSYMEAIMRQYIHNLSMRRRILIMTTLILLGFLICQIVYFRYVTRSYFGEEMRQKTSRIVENVKEDIDNFSRQIQGQLASVYQDPEFMKKLSEKSFDYKDKLYAHNMVVESTIMSNVYALYIYDNDHRLVSSYRKSSSLKNSFPYDLYGEGTLEEQRLKKASGNETAEMSILGYSNPETRNKTVRYVYRLYQQGGSRLVGYMVCDVSRKEIDHIIKRNLYRDEQYLWLETMNGYPISLWECLNEETAEVIRRYQKDKDVQEKDYYDLESYESGYDYTVHSLSSVSYLEKNSREFLRNIVWMISILVLIWGSVLFITSKKMTQQLTLMMQTIRQVEKGNMHVRFTNLYGDELGKLGGQFNHMLDEIEKYIYREYQSKIILNDAKYYALQAQINPHFLFNTLNTMAGIAGAEHCDTVKRMCECLSEIFRYNIAGNIDKKFVALGDELTHIKNYLYIVEQRTMNEIAFYNDIPEEMYDIRIPKLSIQPLIENSVNHGLKNKRGGKYIRVEAQILDEDIQISVIDNGTGADIDKLKDYLNTDDKRDSRAHTSIGLWNINERIHLLFGGKYGISFQAADVMRVNLCIPMIREGEKDEA